MKEHGVKRIPITDTDGALFGIVSTHELMSLLSDEMGEMVKVTERQHQVEAERRPKF